VPIAVMLLLTMFLHEVIYRILSFNLNICWM